MLTLEDRIVGSTRDKLPVEVPKISSTLSDLIQEGRDLTRITCDTSGLENSGGLCPSAEVRPSWSTLDRLLTQGRSTIVILRQTDHRPFISEEVPTSSSVTLSKKNSITEEQLCSS